MSTTAARSRDPVATKAAILAAAEQLFAEKGFVAASVREICEHSEISKPTLYYHFGSKEGLCKSMVEEARQTLLDLLAATERPTADVPTIIGDIIETHFSFCTQNTDLARLWFSVAFGAQRGVPFLEVQKLSRENFSIIRERLRGVAETGLIREERLDEIVGLVRGAVSSYILRFLRGETAAPTRDLAERLGRLIYEGARTRSEGGHS